MSSVIYRAKEYIMTSILEEPYMMLRKPIRGEKLYGNDRYEGYCKDLADAITKHTGIKFLIRPVADGKYGSPDPHNPGGWNGKSRVGGIRGRKLTCLPILSAIILAIYPIISA